MSYERRQVQISAFIAEETKEALDRYVAETGLKKNRFIEEAIERHLAAVDEIPASMMIETRVTTTAEGWAMIWDMMESDREPTPDSIEGWNKHFEFMRTDGKSLDDDIRAQLVAEGKTDIAEKWFGKEETEAEAEETPENDEG